VKRLAAPAMRDKTTIGPLEWVSLDGRTKDFWCDPGDGRTIRMTFLALVDVASCAIQGWELATSENARSTQRLIRSVCERFAIFDRLYPDNGCAFAGHLVAGGIDKSFRGWRASSAARCGGRAKGQRRHGPNRTARPRERRSRLRWKKSGAGRLPRGWQNGV